MKSYAGPILFAGLLVASASVSAQQSAPPSRVRSAQSATRMSNDLVNALHGIAKERSSSSLVGLSKSVNGSLALRVLSYRTLIAWRYASAAEQGARFTPPNDMRLDVVKVSCGDSDPQHLFECSLVSVMNAEGKRVPPVFYSAGPRIYRNGLREVSSIYHIHDLTDGFTVTFADVNGSEWSFEVSADDAENELLLKVDPGSH